MIFLSIWLFIHPVYCCWLLEANIGRSAEKTPGQYHRAYTDRQTHSHLGRFRASTSPDPHMFRLWEPVWTWRKLLQTEREKIQTVHRQAQGWDLIWPMTLLLLGDKTNRCAAVQAEQLNKFSSKKNNNNKKTVLVLYTAYDSMKKKVASVSLSPSWFANINLLYSRLLYGSFQSLSLLEQKILLRFCLWNRRFVPNTVYMSHSFIPCIIVNPWLRKISQIFKNVYSNCHYKVFFRQVHSSSSF